LGENDGEIDLTLTPTPIKAGHPALARQAKALHAEEKDDRKR
jgi:hypothetical protein